MAAKAGAFQEHQCIAYAVPFPPFPETTETGSAVPGAQQMEAGVNNQQYASTGGQSPGGATARLVRIESAVALVLLYLFMLERRIASLEAAMEAISTRFRLPSPINTFPRTSAVVETTPTSHAAEQTAPSERPSISRCGGRCEQPETLLESLSVANATPRRGHRCRLRRDKSSPTPPVADRTQEAAHISEPRGVEQEQPMSDETFSQPDTANPFATYEPKRREPRSRRQHRAHEGRFRDVPATEPPSFTWTPTSLALRVSHAFANGYVEEVFSPVSEVSGYQVRLYARRATKDGCAVLSFCAQLCASIKKHASLWPFRGALKFIIHHPTCSEKSRVYIVPVLQEKRAVPTSDVGQTLFRLTGFIPEMCLHNEGFWAAGTLRVSISVCA